MDSLLKDRRSILIVDDEEGLRYGLEKLFEREGYRVFSSGEYKDAITITNKNKIDVVLLDIRLSGKDDGIELLKELKKAEPDIIILIITGYGSIDSSVKAMKEGASDYILKPIDNNKLIEAVGKKIEIKNLRHENYYLKKTLLDCVFTYDFITDNTEVRNVLKVADKIKDTSASVFITGESGTGKEVLARYIHFTSIRKNSNFVGINCAALSDTLLLSELFGHEKGSFTGAMEQKMGKFELADSGTLFMDEIGDMSLDVQSKLLRVLEERSFERVGGIKTVQVDVRVIAATNRDMKELIKSGQFRQDLYFRLNVISCHLPPLRDRLEDIPLLVSHFLKQYNQRYNRSVESINTGLLESLFKYHWPGNVRELQNMINQAVLLCEGIEIVSFNFQESIISDQLASMEMIGQGKPLKAAIEEIVSYYEKRLIAKVLSDNKQNRTKTAKALDITRKTLARKIDKYDL